MSKHINLRFTLLFLLLFVLAARQLAREHRPSVLRPGLRMYAYVANYGSGTVSVVDLISLNVVSTISVGPAPSGVRAHPTRKEIWGVSTESGHLWVIDAPSSRVAASIYVGASPFALDFSPDGKRAYVAASGSNSVVAVDCDRRQVVARAQVGRSPWVARLTPDGKSLLVPNRDDAALTVLNSADLAPLATIAVARGPQHIEILPDSSKAFVSAAGSARSPASADQVSVVDLKRKILLANLPLPGAAAGLVLKPDGGELFVPAPQSHGLAIVNTWTNEVTDQVLLGSAPAQPALTADGKLLYVSDRDGGRVIPIDIDLRRPLQPIAVGQRPGVARFTPAEELLLVINEASNDLAVIRTRTQSLITLIPVGDRPRDLAIKVF